MPRRRRTRRLLPLLLAAVAVSTAAVPAQQPPRELAALLRDEPRCAPMLREARAHRLQVLLAEPETLPDGRVVLRRSAFGDARQYVYPASSVKLAAALVALVELNRINAATGSAFDLDVALQVHPRFPGDEAGDPVTLREDLRRLFLVSENPPFNHCFELVGPRRLRDAMHAAGFTSFRPWHRLAESRTRRENRQTRAVTLRQHGREHRVPERDDELALDNDGFTDLQLGSAWLDGGRRVEGPMSFAQKNAIALLDLQDLLVETVRPEIDTGKRGFPELSLEQRAFVVRALGELPRESVSPRFDPAEHPDHDCKFVLPGVRAVLPADAVRVYDKIGRAYGFSIENAYVEDRRTGRGFFVAASLYTNPDGVLNDDRYAYAELADPFFAGLGEVLTRAVLGER